MPLGQLELFAICAALLLAATAYGAGRFSRRSTAAAATNERRAPAAPVRMTSPTITAPRAITQWLRADELAVLYVHEWRKNGDTYQAQLTADLDYDIRNFCERYGIALLCAQEVRSALLHVGGISQRREVLKASNPRHQHALEREKVLGLKSGRYYVWYCTRKAPRTGENFDLYTKDEARQVAAKSVATSSKARASAATAPSQSRTRQTPVTRQNTGDEDDLLIGFEIRKAA